MERQNKTLKLIRNQEKKNTKCRTAGKNKAKSKIIALNANILLIVLNVNELRSSSSKKE